MDNTHNDERTIGRAEKAILGLSWAGVAFAGYLTFSKIITGTCAFGETCPTFLGYPTCWYGLGMYLILAAMSTLLALGKCEPKRLLSGISGVGILGILFAGYYTMGEIGVLFSDGIAAFALGLPTCAWGLIVYIIITALALPKAMSAGSNQ
jgi:hypothetical protein